MLCSTDEKVPFDVANDSVDSRFITSPTMVLMFAPIAESTLSLVLPFHGPHDCISLVAETVRIEKLFGEAVDAVKISGKFVLVQGATMQSPA